MNKPWYKSTAILGALGVVVSVATSPQVLALVPEKYAWAAASLSFLLNQWGQRTAVAKNGNGS